MKAVRVITVHVNTTAITVIYAVALTRTESCGTGTVGEWIVEAIEDDGTGTVGEWMVEAIVEDDGVKFVELIFIHAVEDLLSDSVLVLVHIWHLLQSAIAIHPPRFSNADNNLRISLQNTSDLYNLNTLIIPQC